MKKIAIAILIAALVVVSGCAVKELPSDTTPDTTQAALEDVTPEDTASEVDTLVLNEDGDLNIGEML